MRQGISCQNNNPTSVCADYIYLKFNKKAKEQTLLVNHRINPIEWYGSKSGSAVMVFLFDISQCGIIVY